MKQKETWLTESQRTLMVQSALSSVLFSIGTGNFLAGYLTYLGASPAFCAIVAAVPQLGCILQLVSPFLFERLCHRKMAIRICCFAFRMGMGLAGLIPFMLTGYGAALLGASAQSMLQLHMGIQSIRILFLGSGVFCLAAVLLIVPKLPKIILGTEM